MFGLILKKNRFFFTELWTNPSGLMFSQPVTFVEKFVWIQLWLSIYVNTLNVTYQAVVAWWQLMQGATREVQMLKWGFTLTLAPPLSPSLLVFFCGDSAQVCTWQIKDGILDALPITLSFPGVGTGSGWSTGQLWIRTWITPLWSHPLPHEERYIHKGLRLFHKFMWHVCFYPLFISFILV